MNVLLWRRLGAMVFIGSVAAAAHHAAAGGEAAASAPSSDRREQMASQSGKAPRQGGIEGHQLAPIFPATVGAWKREQFGRPLPQPVPALRPAMRALYSQGDQRAEITVHAGKPTGEAPGSRKMYSEVRTARSDTLVTITLPNGLQFAATSPSSDAATLEALLRGLDLARAEALAPERR